MEFEKRKAATMAAITSTHPDKSPKGSLDTPIIPLITTINNHPSYFTTSSCSGRVSIFSHLPNKPKGGSWLFISHARANPTSVLKLLFPSESIHHLHGRAGSESNESIHIPHGRADPESIHPESVRYQNCRAESGSMSHGRAEAELTRSDSAELGGDESKLLVFRFEPLIIAVECKDVGAAQFLVSIAVSCGFRESGITSVGPKRVIVAVRSSIRLEVPLGCKGKILVSSEYVRYLVEVANEKMSANFKRTQGFLEGLRKNGFVCPSEAVGVRDGMVGLNGGGGGEYDDEENWGVVNQEVTNLNGHNGPPGKHVSSLDIIPIKIVGEEVERLFLWGHSSCAIGNDDSKEILIYGGFGGIGRHARRSDCLLLDPSSGRLSIINVKDCPSPRMGHTSSLVGGSMIVIGGRADPTNILDDVWFFDIKKVEWKLVGNTGDVFSPRHRHAAAVVGSNIYVFGGLDDNKLYSSLLVLDINTLKWKELQTFGDLPCARHSHSLVSYENKLYLFGGYNGERALGDLYSFDIQECRWAKINTVGKAPNPRFSHSMFVYKHYLGIIGGCPVRQHCEELSLLDIHTSIWKDVILNSSGKPLLVRSTASIIKGDLIMIGGGTSCYAFGTKFSEPSKINLLSLSTLSNVAVSSMSDDEQSTRLHEDISEKSNNGFDFNASVEPSGLQTDAIVEGKEPSCNVEHASKLSFWVLKLQKRYAKLGKDLLKKFGWLDLGRKVYSSEDGSCIYFPITEKFSAMFSDEQLIKNRGVLEGLSDLNILEISSNSCDTALDFLVACGAMKHIDELVSLKKTPVSPLEVMKTAVDSILKQHGLSDGLLEELPARWERLGDIIVLPINSFKDPAWDTIGSELWSAVAKVLGARRLARQGHVASIGTRLGGSFFFIVFFVGLGLDSSLHMQDPAGGQPAANPAAEQPYDAGNGWVEHRENGIVYCFDATKCMFSWGNLSEKLRMARLNCGGEVIVDLFAGIGYFTLPFLVRAHAKLVYACEWNLHAVEALHHNLEANSVSDRCIVLKGDNRLTAPKGVANRVSLGLLPSSEDSWVTAVKALRCEGGTLHVHGNVKDSEERQWTQHVVNSISEIAKTEGRCWKVSLVHLERVKWYAPHIRHLVADILCEEILN